MQTQIFIHSVLAWTIAVNLVNVSVNSNWVHPPGQPPGISSKNLPGGRDLTFESCLGTGNSTRVGILWKMKLKLQKNSEDQSFTGENNKNKKTSRIFYLFRGLRVFSIDVFLVYGSLLVALSHIPYKKSEELSLACLFEVFTGLWLSAPTFCMKSYDC